MGYFPKLAIGKECEHKDRSYPGFEQQLLWRYEDLCERYFELLDIDAPCFGEARFSVNDYRYCPINAFTSVQDVYRAMEIAKDDLEEKCGITVDLPTEERLNEEEERDDDQVTLLEIVLLPSWFQTAMAA